MGFNSGFKGLIKYGGTTFLLKLQGGDFKRMVLGVFHVTSSTMNFESGEIWGCRRRREVTLMADDGWMQRWCKKQGIFDSSAGFLCFSVASLHFIFHFIYFGAFRGKKRDIPAVHI